MAGGGILTSRWSKGEWCVRICIAIAATGLGYTAITYALAYSIRGIDPAYAHALAPGDGRITALLSEQLSGPEASPADRVQSDSLARQALHQDPTAIAAVATLGINAQIRNNTALARHIFAYGNRLSRRDLRTRLWWIEDAVSRGDVQGALRQYDIALRTSRLAPDLLFPVLAKALDDPAIRLALVSRLKTQPTWSGPFIVYLADNAVDTISVASLFKDIAKADVLLPAASRAVLIRRLGEQGKFDEAWNLYSAITPGVDRRRSRDPNFTATPAEPSIFDWVSIENDGVVATFQHDEGGGVFEFSVPPGIGGPVLRQAQLLPPGEYFLEGRATGIDLPGSSQPYWALICANTAEIGRVPIGVRSEGKFSGKLQVSKSCPVQYLSLIIRPSDKNEEIIGRIYQVKLNPIKQ